MHRPDGGMKAGQRWSHLDALIAQTNQGIVKRIADKTGH